MLVRVTLPRVPVIRNDVADWHIRVFANNGQGQQDAKWQSHSITTNANLPEQVVPMSSLVWWSSIHVSPSASTITLNSP